MIGRIKNILNPKSQYLNSKFPNSEQMWFQAPGFQIWDLFRISDFGFRILIFWITISIFAIWILSLPADTAYAKEITVFYTGETHAMLYPCNCPGEPDGGVARRATLLKQLRKDSPDCLVLDSGGFFAGGLLDEYTQNTQLDMQRTIVNLKAMELMKYDALAIGNDEFNFGGEFFQDTIAQTNLTFLSCNIKADKVLPYIIKELAGIKIGIIAVTALTAVQKAGGLKFSEPNAAVADAVAQAKREGAGIIVLLSRLSESENSNLINSVASIDILIAGSSRSKEESYGTIGNTVVLRPSWQGRHLGKASFKIDSAKITECKIEELRLSDKVPDDPGILSVLPQCFSDINCKKEGLSGTCQNAGNLNSRCLFSEPNKIKLLIVTSQACLTCNTEIVVNFLKRRFPGLVSSYLYYPGRKAKNLLKELAISGLPIYLLGKEIEKEKNFEMIKGNLEEKGKFYMLSPQFSGIAYFLGRKKIKGKLDLFISLNDKKSAELLDTIKEFNPEIHFLAVERKDGFDASGGNLEVEEYLRAVCVKKYYPDIFWDYISCRSKNMNSSWWEDCVPHLDTHKIKACARGNEGSSLLRENIALNKELKVMFGPAYLLDNQEIFSTKGKPTKEEFRKIFKRGDK